MENEKHILRVHKYRRVDKRLIEILVNSDIYLPTPDQLNDPFDCQVDLDRAVRVAFDRCSGEPSNYWKNIKEDLIPKLRNKIETNLLVGSFSHSNDETLLWSHYADSHRGVVLTYEFPVLSLWNASEIIGISPVSYSQNAVTDFLFENRHETNKGIILEKLVSAVLSSKHPAWQYEQEIRFLRPKTCGSLAVPRSTLVEITFGLRTSQSDKELIRKLVENHYGDWVKFSQIERTEHDFGIRVAKAAD